MSLGPFVCGPELTRCVHKRCNLKSPLDEPSELFRLENLMSQNAGAGNNWAKAHYAEAGQELG
jgi:hypothetical protein